MVDYYAIDAAERKLREVREAYVQVHGWLRTCQTPGAMWMWRRSFADVNDTRLQNHRAFCARIGEERQHHPYPDEMLVDLDTAVRMTWTEIDPARLEIDLED